MAHQGGKFHTREERKEMFKWLSKLEFELLELPQADIKIFLHMPYEYSLKLKANRCESLDENERDKQHLLDAERAYIELANDYSFHIIECVKNDNIRKIEDINDELYNFIKDKIKEKNKL